MTDNEYKNIATDCEYKTNFGVTYAYSKKLLHLGAQHGLSCRMGGVSSGGYSELNLGWNKPESQEVVEENYKILCKAAELDYQKLALVAYCHGNGILQCDKNDCNKGFGKGEFDPCDGLITNDPEITLVTLHADCMPVIMYDSVKNAGACIHAGWKGAHLGIGKIGAKMLQQNLGCEAKNINVWIGPSLSQKHFEVDLDVCELFRADYGEECICYLDKTKKYYIDLWRVMVLQLQSVCIELENIYIAKECTYEKNDIFHSYRKGNKISGSMAGFLRLRQD